MPGPIPSPGAAVTHAAAFARRASTVVMHVPRYPVASPVRLPPTRSFSDLRPPAAHSPKPYVDEPGNELVSTSSSDDSGTPVETRITVPAKFSPFAMLANLGEKILDAVEEHQRPVYQAGRAVGGAVIEKARELAGPVIEPTYQREVPPYQTLDKLHPGMVHEQTLQKAGIRAPQFHLTPDQFDALSKANPVVGWIAHNARFQASGMCYGEAFAEVRRMAGVSLEKSRENVTFDSYYPIPNDFKQLNTQDLASVVSEAGVVVFTGAGQLVAGDSHQRLVESGNYTNAQMAEGGAVHWAEGRVNHSVILIDDKSGLVPKGHVIVYDMDPFCKRYASLHDPNTATPPGQATQPDPHFVPEGSRHHVLRIVSFDGLKNETDQFGLLPKVMVPRFEVGITRPTALPEPASITRSIEE